MNSKNMICVCGKKRGVLNKTNWSRHIDVCERRKIHNCNMNISKFFKSVINVGAGKKLYLDSVL